jgi:hypothetical protein
MTTKIKKIPAPECFICLWCKRKIAAGAPSLAVEVDGTRLFFCAECGRGVQETGNHTAKERIIRMLVDGERVTARGASESAGCSRDYANLVLKRLYDAKKVYRGVLCDDRGNACGYVYTNRNLKISTLTPQTLPETMEHT